MIFKEVAIEPAYLSNWDRVRLVIDQCGFDQGRLISEFPKRWQWKVFEACANCAPVEKKRIEEYLNGVKPKLIRTGRNYLDSADWISNAEREHKRLPFFAVVTNAACADKPGFIHGQELHAKHERWVVPSDIVVRRTTEEMASCTAELLREAREVVFIDPHFEVKAAFTKPLCRFVKLALEGKPLVKIEYHLKCDCSKEHFQSKLKDTLLRFFPQLSSSPLRLVRWKSLDQDPRDAMHARYILCDVGGLRFDYGLCEGNEGETTDVQIVPKTGEIYRQRWTEFAAESTVFKFVDGFEITRGGSISEICIRDGCFQPVSPTR